MKLFGSLSAISFSPIVTIEPRRRKFHCPIKLRIPLPPGYRLESSGNLRLLCSITGGQSKALWEDVTGSTPLSIHDKCLLFTTTVSARFWLVHCQRAQRCQDAARFAQELWRYLIQVPFMAKFVVFAKRRDINEAQVRVFCMTDDKEEKTLEVQEHYTLVARSRDVEVLDGQVLYLEFAGNLIPAHLNGSLVAGGGGFARGPGGRPNSGLLVANSSVLLNEQLAFAFRAFQENRLAFACRLREVGQEPSGRIAFMEDSLKYLASLNQQQRAFLAERRRRAVCTLGIQLPAMCVHYDNILGTPKRNSYYSTATVGELSLADIASELSLARAPSLSPEPALQQQQQQQYASGSELSAAAGFGARLGSSGPRKPDWMELAPRLGIPRDEVDYIAEHCGTSGSAGVTPALLLLMHWFRLASPDDRDQDLARGLLAIGRDDIARKLNFPIEPKRISRSTAELLREIEQIPVRSTENLYGGSELSAASSARQHQRATSTASSLRRLDELAGGDQERGRRFGSTSSIQRQESARPNNYFNSGLSQRYDQPPAPQQRQVIDSLPSIEVSRPQRAAGQPNAMDRPETNCVGGEPDEVSAGARRQHLEQLARQVVEEALDEALQHYLRLELQQTAEETVREALIAAGLDDSKKRPLIEVVEEEVERTLTSEPANATRDEEDSESTLNKMDAEEILQDLSEMSNFVDRIDSILDQTASEHSARSGRLRSVSPMPQQVVEEHQQAADGGEPPEEEVD